MFGFHFLEDGDMYERKNAGWCGTPPITCCDYKGTGSQNNSTLSITFVIIGEVRKFTSGILLI